MKSLGAEAYLRAGQQLLSVPSYVGCATANGGVCGPQPMRYRLGPGGQSPPLMAAARRLRISPSWRGSMVRQL